MTMEPLVAIDMAQHVAAEIMDMVKKTGTSLKAYSSTVEYVKTIESHRGTGGDTSGIYGAVRIRAGWSTRLERLETRDRNDRINASLIAKTSSAN